MLMMIKTSAADETPVDCAGGACPNPFTDAAPLPPDVDTTCGMWLGPSPIKQAEEHGFGLGIFTGNSIKKGSPVGDAELLIPIFDSSLDQHPPLREYIWDGDNMPELTLESRRGTWLFMPGLAGIAACTDQNFNLALLEKGQIATAPRDNVVVDSAGVHRAKDATAGSFSYRHNTTYTAVRDIVAGEELTVQCSDDSFDGGAYYLSRFHSNDNAVACVDSNVRIDVSTIAGAGRGLFAKRNVPRDEVIISTPLIPIHKNEMDVPPSEDNKGDIPQKQLLLNYCYGHPRSDLLLLPYGPVVNYVNNAKEMEEVNAVIRWHPSDNKNNDLLPRRQQHHHPELLDLPAEIVADTHGKGLMMDIVALRDISENEEIFIDYGSDWSEAWKSHVESFESSTEHDKQYISASDYNHANDEKTSVVRTASEQQDNPYPENLQTVCFFTAGVGVSRKEANGVVYTSWNTAEYHQCLRPCSVLDRYEQGGAILHKAEMLPLYDGLTPGCELDGNYVVTDIPREAIRIADRPYTSDVFLKNAFRHAIGVPDGFFPETWMQKNMRRRSQKQSESDADFFKRKKN